MFLFSCPKSKLLCAVFRSAFLCLEENIAPKSDHSAQNAKLAKARWPWANFLTPFSIRSPAIKQGQYYLFHMLAVHNK